MTFRACDKISDALRRERRAGRCKAARRRRCGDIVEERQRNRCPPAAAPLRAAARRPADCVARSSHTTRYARRSRLASGPGGLQRSASLILSQALSIRGWEQMIQYPDPSKANHLINNDHLYHRAFLIHIRMFQAFFPGAPPSRRLFSRRKR